MLSKLSSAERDSRRRIMPLAEKRSRRGLLDGKGGFAYADETEPVMSEIERGRARERVADVVLMEPRRVGMEDFCSMMVVNGVP